MNKIVSSYTGFFLWRRIVKHYKVNLFQDFIVILPKGEERINYYMLLYLNKLIEVFEITKKKLLNSQAAVLERNELFIVLTDDELILRYAKNICRRVLVLPTNTVELQGIIDSYCMYPYSNRMFIGQTEGIQARGGKDSLRAIGISEEELVANGIYDLRIKHFNRDVRPKIPKMEGLEEEFCNYVRRNDLRLSNG